MMMSPTGMVSPTLPNASPTPKAPFFAGFEPGSEMHGLVLMRPEPKEGRMQKGLIRSEPNPSGRRMIAVAMSTQQLFDLVRVRQRWVLVWRYHTDCCLFLPCVCLPRPAGLVACSAHPFTGRLCRPCVCCVLSRQMRIFSLGFVLRAGIECRKNRRRTLLLALGVCIKVFRERRLRRYRNLFFQVGFVLGAIRRRNEARRRALLFALGLPALLMKQRQR
jgi:hypothetical protein